MPTSAQLLAELKLLHPLLIDLSLGRVRRLLAKLGDPHERLPPCVHIAGTNGKGSVTAYLKAMLEAAGARVHVYTSPHLVRFHERIELAGAERQGARHRRGDPHRRADAHAGDERRRRHHPVRDHDGGGVPRVRRAPGRRAAARGRARRAPRCDERHRAARSHGHHAGLARPFRKARRDACQDRLREGRHPARRRARRRVAAGAGGRGRDPRRSRAPSARPLAMWGEHFDAYEQRGRLVVQSEDELLDLPLPALIGRHQIVNAGTAVAAALQLRARLPSIGLDECVDRGGPHVGALARAHAAARRRSAALAVEARLRAVARRRPQPRRRPRAGADARRSGGALAQARASHRRHDGPEGFGRASCRRSAALPATSSRCPFPARTRRRTRPRCSPRRRVCVGLEAEWANGVETALKRTDQFEAGPKRILICGSLYLAGHVLGLQEGVEPQAN